MPQMISPSDPYTAQVDAPLVGAEDARGRTEALEPGVSQPEKVEMAASDFDAVLLFPSEGVTAGEPSEGFSFFPDRQVRPSAPAFDALADGVTRETRALEHQKLLKGSAFIDAERLNEMAQLRASYTAQLNEGHRQVARIEQMLGWIEELAARAAAQLERVTKMTDDLVPTLARFEREAQTRSDSTGSRVEQLIVKEIEGEPRGWYAREILYRRWLSRASTALATHTPSWIARRGPRALGGLGVLVVLGAMFMRFPGEFDRLGTNQVVLQTRSVLIASSPGMEWLGTLARSTVTVLEESPREAEFEKPPATRQFFGALTVQSDPSGATVFVKGRPVGTTPLRLKRLAAGTHVVRVEGVGYERWTSAVLVPAERLTLVRASLHRELTVGTGRIQEGLSIVAGREGPR